VNAIVIPTTTGRGGPHSLGDSTLVIVLDDRFCEVYAKACADVSYMPTSEGGRLDPTPLAAHP